MSADIQERLIALFDKVADKDMEFSKNVYPDVFGKIYEAYRDIFEAITSVVNEAKDKESIMHEIAEYLPCYAAEKIDMTLPRKKTEPFLVQYNMGLTTYVLPALNYIKTDACSQTAEMLVKSWNKRFSTQIGNTTYEQVYGGFRQRLCYITTAVCKSLGKADDCYELETLRNYRDQYLMEERHGVELVKEYYNTAPTIVKHIDRLEEKRKYILKFGQNI